MKCPSKVFEEISGTFLRKIFFFRNEKNVWSDFSFLMWNHTKFANFCWNNEIFRLIWSGFNKTVVFSVILQLSINWVKCVYKNHCMIKSPFINLKKQSNFWNRNLTIIEITRFRNFEWINHFKELLRVWAQCFLFYLHLNFKLYQFDGVLFKFLL